MTEFNHSNKFSYACIHVTVGIMGRTSNGPNSAHSLFVDKAQNLRSGIFTYASLVLHPIIVET